MEISLCPMSAQQEEFTHCTLACHRKDILHTVVSTGDYNNWIMEERFWKIKSPRLMTPAEWESLCDGCAQCCRHKLEDVETGDIYITRVVCRLLDLDTCRCTAYGQRHELNPECVILTPELAERLHWLPETCAYRQLVFGVEFQPWHPLNSGNSESVHDAGISVRGKVVSERDVNMEQLEEYIEEE
jgi:uncharacterized cysteine cluster protein YcgN (CxxCxxCC family)